MAEADDLIRNEGPKVIGHITIRVIEPVPGQTATQVEYANLDEITCYGLLRKAEQVLAAMFMQQAMANAPRVIPANGTLDAYKRHMRQS